MAILISITIVIIGIIVVIIVITIVLTIVIFKRRGLIILLIVVGGESELSAKDSPNIGHMFLAPLLPDASGAIGSCEGGIGGWLSEWNNNPTRSRLFCRENFAIGRIIDNVLHLRRDSMMTVGETVDTVLEEEALVVESAECPLLGL